MIAFESGLRHITQNSRNLEDDECGWDAAGIPKRYVKDHPGFVVKKNLRYLYLSIDFENLNFGEMLMEFVKLNIGWDAEPNAPMPKVSVSRNSDCISLEFFLNSFIHDDVNEEDLGVLEFNNCYLYRLGPTKQEDFDT